MQTRWKLPLQIELLPRGRVFTWILPVPGTSVSSTRQCHKYPGYGYNMFIPARSFWEFCKTFAPVPGTSVSSVQPVPQIPRGTGTACFVPARNPCEFCAPVRVTIPGPSFCEFCNTSVPVPETSGSFCKTPHITLPEIHNPYRT